MRAHTHACLCNRARSSVVALLHPTLTPPTRLSPRFPCKKPMQSVPSSSEDRAMLFLSSMNHFGKMSLCAELPRQFGMFLHSALLSILAELALLRFPAKKTSGPVRRTEPDSESSSVSKKNKPLRNTVIISCLAVDSRESYSEKSTGEFFDWCFQRT